MRRWDIIDAMRKMKKTLLSLAVASLAVVFASCGSSKTVVDNGSAEELSPEVKAILHEFDEGLENIMEEAGFDTNK